MILASEAFIAAHIHNFLRQTGPSLSPFNAWVMLKALETLPVRVAAQVRSAEKIADYPRRASGRRRACFIPAATIIRRRRSPSGR